MVNFYSKKDSRLIEKAIIFLVTEYSRSGFNKKPVIFHSLRVACLLAESGLPATTVAAAVLHDLLEDSKVTVKQIQKKFGSKIADLVTAVSFKPEVNDKVKQYQEMFERTRIAGFEALMIKCADILDNSTYYNYNNKKKVECLLVDKLLYFMKIAEPKLKKIRIYKELKMRCQLLLTQKKK